ncbi:LolA family protein [Sediminitomix flava]|uniref:Outer membrane lipoprotein-sorting protein n=1 Tax=Sediminitomix flava TaxID=379075 RepID=A0A315Z7F9_SEDFL|nr:outer membrane lipoprotein carrier protein LolA [Sediminitomix flava]PWJ40172.1 outer membrane lipoprotein-sorting protein [Sediminitomix flava]
MKHIFTAFLGLFMVLSNVTFAQKDAKAKKVLDQMSEMYKSLDGFEANILQEDYKTGDDKPLGSNLIEIAVKGNKYRLTLGDQVVYNNGEAVYTFMKSDQEVTVTDPEEEGDDVMSDPSAIYTLYEEGFKYLYKGSESMNGAQYDVIDLSPEDHKNDEFNFYRLVMYINKANHQLDRWEVYMKGNSKWNLFKVSNFKANSLEDNLFTFDEAKYPDVEVIDLR